MSGLPLKPRSVLLCLFTGFIIVLASPHTTYSQYVPCYIVNLKVSHPDSAPAGQPLQVTTTLTASCQGGGYFIIRVDLVETEGSKILSTVTNPYYPTSSSFTTPPLVNEATAPISAGSWTLQVEAHVISQPSGAVAASTAQLFSINIVPYIAPTTTTQAVTTTSIVSTSSFSLTSATSQEVLNTQTTSSTSTENSVDQTGIYATTAAVIVLLLMIILTIRKRRERAAREHTKVY